MARNPVRTPAFLDPVTGYPAMTTVGRRIPVTRNFFITSVVEMPFRTDPYVMSVRPGGAFDHMFMRSFSYILMLSAGAKGGQGKGGSEQGCDH